MADKQEDSVDRGVELKGKETDKSLTELERTVEDLWNKLKEAIDAIDFELPLLQIKRQIIVVRNRLNKYNRGADELCSYFSRRKHEEASAKDFESFYSLHETRKTQTKCAIDEATDFLETFSETNRTDKSKTSKRSHDTRSNLSKTSRKSGGSVESQSAIAKADAAAAKAKAEIILKKIELQTKQAAIEEQNAIETATAEQNEKIRAAIAARKKVEFDSNLELLNREEMLATANARAEVLENELLGIQSEMENIPIDEQNPIQLPRTSRMENVSEFISQLQPSDEGEKSDHAIPLPRETQIQSDNLNEHIFAQVQTPLENRNRSDDQNVRSQNQTDDRNFTSVPNQSPILNRPDMNTIPSPHREEINNSSAVNGWFQYFARKDLVLQGLTQFDEAPENFRSWKLSFQNAIRSASLSPSEELDLLVKWTGAKSSELVKKIRAVNIHNPRMGLTEAWGRLEEAYGRPEVITNSLLKLVKDFPKITARDDKKLRELSDILIMLESAKRDGSLPGLTYLDTYLGVNEIVRKLPFTYQEKWRSRGREYKVRHNVPFPPFEYFMTFIKKLADERNDPSFNFVSEENAITSYSTGEKHVRNAGYRISVRKTDVENQDGNMFNPSECPIHKRPHPLKLCKTFKGKPLPERIQLLKEFGICFKCCSSVDHIAKDCKSVEKCSDCGSDKHITALHIDRRQFYGSQSNRNMNVATKQYGGEANSSLKDQSSIEMKQNSKPKTESTSVNTTCTEVCSNYGYSSCAKICLAKVYMDGKPESAVKVYIMLDDQSNRSLMKTDLFELLNIDGQSVPYTLRTCSGDFNTAGRRVNGLIVESLDGKVICPLPTIIECNNIPDNRTEIPSPSVAKQHPHLFHVSKDIPEIDETAQILLLLGRDVLRLHKVREQRNGPGDSPFAQRTDLGWVIVGNMCLNGTHKPNSVNSFKTHTLENGRQSFFEPCPNKFTVKGDTYMGTNVTKHSTCEPGKFYCDSYNREGSDKNENMTSVSHETFFDGIGEYVFQTTKNDNKVGLSIEDRKFLELMGTSMKKDISGNWIAPLPLKIPRPTLANNREAAYNRLLSLKRTLDRKPEMKKHYLHFMEDIFLNNHAEVAPELTPEEECWFLPHFGVYHPHKRDKIRVVFDSSATFKGHSLNDVLMKGPDLMNSLVGVLMRFRHCTVGVMADIKQMFHSFLVSTDHRNFLRFLWHKNNDSSAEIVEYRMRVHLFGNKPSPSVATFGLNRTAESGECEFGSDARKFVERNFYVDDALKSFNSAGDAIDLLQRTQKMLGKANLVLHKIASNSAEVLKAFPVEEQAKDLQNLDLSSDEPSTQRSLGVHWDLKMDAFTFKISLQEKSYTRRGILSVINSLYDPLGFVAPVLLKGKCILRSILDKQDSSYGVVGWDEPLPVSRQQEWDRWRNSLLDLSNLTIPRAYCQTDLSKMDRKELHIFSDASDIAISTVGYLRLIDSDKQCHVSFIMGKSKLAPMHATTVPRLELCAAVLSVELYELIQQEIDIPMDSVVFYTDSKVTLGYINNESKRFYVYVGNRVQRIRSSTDPNQWHYVSTHLNPADCGTRFTKACDIDKSVWLKGPAFLHSLEQESSVEENNHVYSIATDKDPEMRTDTSSFHTEIEFRKSNLSERFSKFSKWERLVRAVKNLSHVSRSFHKTENSVNKCHGWHICDLEEPSESEQAERLIIEHAQMNSFADEKGDNVFLKIVHSGT